MFSTVFSVNDRRLIGLKDLGLPALRMKVTIFAISKVYVPWLCCISQSVSIRIHLYPFLPPLKKGWGISHRFLETGTTEISQSPSTVVEEVLFTLPPHSPPLWALFVSEGNPPDCPNESPGKEEISLCYFSV